MSAATKQMAISEFKARCLKVLDQVKRTGQPLLITRRGEPIALVTPPQPEALSHSWLGSMRTRGHIEGDVITPATPSDDWQVLRS